MGELGAGDVRGVHIKKGQRKDRRGQRGEEGEGAHPPSLHPAPFSALIAGSESQSQAEVSLGFCWARHWVPLSSAGSMLDSIWPAGPREQGLINEVEEYAQEEQELLSSGSRLLEFKVS